MSCGIILTLLCISRWAGVEDPNLMNNPYCRYLLYWNLAILLILQTVHHLLHQSTLFPELVLQHLNEIYILNTPGTHD